MRAQILDSIKCLTTNLGLAGQFFGEQFIMPPTFTRKTMISLFSDLEPIFRIWILGTFIFYKYTKFTGYFSPANQVNN